MSASRDASQKVAFVYTNFYSLYKKGKKAATVAAQPFATVTAPESGRIIRSGHLRPGLRIRDFEPTSFDSPKTTHSKTQAVKHLRDSLNSLKDLRSRLHFMLSELEELSGKKTNE